MKRIVFLSLALSLSIFEVSANAMILTPGQKVINAVLQRKALLEKKGVFPSRKSVQEQVAEEADLKARQYGKNLGKFIAAIHVNYDSPSSEGSGALVYRDEVRKKGYILTSCHLFKNSFASHQLDSISVSFSEDPYQDPDSWIKADAHFLHPACVKGTFEKDSDLALIEIPLTQDVPEAADFGIAEEESRNQVDSTAYFFGGYGNFAVSFAYNLNPMLNDLRRRHNPLEFMKVGLAGTFDIVKKTQELTSLLPGGDTEWSRSGIRRVSHTAGIFNTSTKSKELGSYTLSIELESNQELAKVQNDLPLNYTISSRSKAYQPLLDLEFSGIPAAGDSGGPLYRYDSNSNLFRVIGIFKGYMSNPLDATVSMQWVAVTPSVKTWVLETIKSH
jgi:hypothetical protein